VRDVEKILDAVRNPVQARADPALGEIRIRAGRLLEGELLRDGDEIPQLGGQAADAIEVEAGQLDAGDRFRAQPRRLLPGGCECDIRRRGRQGTGCRGRAAESISGSASSETISRARR